MHTDIGHTCIGAKVNQQAYPLSQPLVSGQTIEIITTKGARPNAAWMNFVVTGRARSRIRSMLKNLENHDAKTLGQRLLNYALSPKKLSDFDPELVDKVVKDTQHENFEDLLVNIGLGNIMSMLIAQRLLNNTWTSHHEETLPLLGTEGLLVSFAKCYCPFMATFHYSACQSWQGLSGAYGKL